MVLGRNRELAWGFTNTGSDTQDLFIERVDPADPGRYLTPGRQRAVHGPRTRRSPCAAARPCRSSPRHPPRPGRLDLAAATAEVAGAGRGPGPRLDPAAEGRTRTVAAGFALGRARDRPSSWRRPSAITGAQQNMAFAVRDGTIGMISPGLVPIRRQGDGRLPVPGWTGDYDWVGTIPADRLPRAVDPPGGLLVNANNRLVDGSYPYFLTADWEPPLRARRIVELLGQRRDLDADAMAAVQLDVSLRRWPTGSCPTCRSPRRSHRTGASCSRRCAPGTARPWPGGRSRWSSPPGTTSSGRAIAGDELGPALADLGTGKALFLGRVLEQRQVWCDVSDTAAVETCAERSAAAFATAMAALDGRYGQDWRSWRWGDAHPAVLAHRPFEVSLCCGAGSAACCRSAATTARSTWPMPDARATSCRSGWSMPRATGRSTTSPHPTAPAGSPPPASPATRCRGTTPTLPDHGSRAAT